MIDFGPFQLLSGIYYKRKPQSNILLFLYFPRFDPLYERVIFCVFQGDTFWKGQLNECWEPGDCLWSNAYAASGAECLDNPEWHEAAETGGAAYDRAWRCLILRTEAWRLYNVNEMNNYLFCQRGLSSRLDDEVSEMFGLEFETWNASSAHDCLCWSWFSINIVLLLWVLGFHSHFFTTQSAVSHSSLKTFSTSVHSVMMTELCFFFFFLKICHRQTPIIGGVKTKTHDSSQVNFPTYVHIVI